MTNKKRKYCNPMVKETFRKINDNGYVLILDGLMWKLEHKIVVENFIGRKLKKEEVIHHLDFNKKNNKIENLMLFHNQKEHASFHIKIKKFGITNPIAKQIEERWENFK
jgi:hypothetical protein